MASELKLADSTQRLANQLQTLSEVAEVLTFRILELEERLNLQEQQIQSLLGNDAQAAGLISGDTELRLVDTEGRLARIEGLLAAPQEFGNGFQPEIQPDIQPDFQEEPEQSFMDELCA